MEDPYLRVPSYAFGSGNADLFAEHEDQCVPLILRGTTSTVISTFL
jgi:hypothetical protein